MSRDIEIAAHLRPAHRDILEILAPWPELGLSGDLDAGAPGAAVESRRAGEVAVMMEIDGPFAIEPDDLDEALASAVLAPRWLLRLSLPASSSGRDFALARSLAIELARRRQGAVYDPQGAAILWPRGKRRRGRTDAAEERIRVVSLEWFLPASAPAEALSAAFLAATRRLFPEAVPTRFGAFEPFRGKLVPGDDRPFVASWEAARGAPFGEVISWKATRPCFGGSVSFPDPREQFRPAGVRRAVRLSIGFDGRPLHSDSCWREATVDLFAGVARKLGAFYGAGYVRRGAIAKRGSVWYDGTSETWALQRSRWWLGLPPRPTWLGWFGTPYRERVEPALSRHGIVAPEGILLRLGDEPMDLDELAGRFPKLPRELLATGDDGPAEVVPEV